MSPYTLEIEAVSSNAGILDSCEQCAHGEVDILWHVLSGIGKSDIPQVYLLIFAEVAESWLDKFTQNINVGNAH
jgi:hypothetical protein